MKYIPLFLFFSILISAQKIGFVYEVKYKLSTDDSTKPHSETMILDIENEKSIFRTKLDKQADSLALLNKQGMYTFGIEHQFYVKKNINDNSIVKIITHSNNNFALPITEKLDWNILPAQKIIGKHKSQKAETSYGGRKWTAWFAGELSFNDGPYVFHGLPGLIISIEDNRNDYVFTLIQVKKSEDLFDVRLKSTAIDWPKYKNLAKSFYNDPYGLHAMAGKTVTFTDANGEKLDGAELTKNRQEEIKGNNNPVELNQKISY